MTTREMFEKVRAHLLKQGRQSMLPKPREEDCAYRGEGGLMCAVGCLITDECYTTAIEGRGIRQLTWDGTLRRNESVTRIIEASIGRAISDDEVSMLSGLQGIHDDEYPGDWELSLKDLEQEYAHILN